MAGLDPHRDALPLGEATGSSRRHVVPNPAGDERFCAAVAGLADEAASPADLEQALRAQYPRVRVSEGVTQGVTSQWYAYRDGLWVNPFA